MMPYSFRRSGTMTRVSVVFDPKESFLRNDPSGVNRQQKTCVRNFAFPVYLLLDSGVSYRRTSMFDLQRKQFYCFDLNRPEVL
jgi:hypothetical protein